MMPELNFPSIPLAVVVALAAGFLVGCEHEPTSPEGPALNAPDLLLAAAPSKRPSKPPPEQDSFLEHLDFYDTSRWMKADGWKNGSPFDNAWSAENVLFQGGEMILRLDNVPRLGEPYSSGHYQTLGFHGYGCYEASFKPVLASGVVTSFFTFAGPYDNGGNGKHNEIDIEFVGESVLGGETLPWAVQFNFYTNDDTYASRNEHMHLLGFDPTEDFHRYGFKWTSGGIAWFVDGEDVYGVEDTPSNPTPKTSDSLQKIMMNLWPVDETASGWAGTFAYPGDPLEAVYKWVRFIKGEGCDLSAAPTGVEPPPPSGDLKALAVAGISLSLDARKTQVIARVSVIDGTGSPAAGATVTGAWSGVITNGDTRRDTNSDGMATFYSGRTKTSGQVTFCVTNITRAGSTYEGTETCASIMK